ncbi:MAG: ABC transporter permease [Planctomycetaceae bacterium]
MRPYLAIIRDSFREVLASRTLLVLLVLITILLIGLAIPGLRIERPWELTAEEVLDDDGLAALLGRTRADGLSPSQQQIRERLSPGLQQQFVEYRKEATAENRDSAVEQFVKEINPLLTGVSLYDEAAWRDVSISPEGQSLLSEKWEELPVDSRRRLNRLLLDGAFDRYLRAVDPLRSYLTYVFGELELGLPTAAVQSLLQSVVYFLLKWFVGAIGVFAAVIFTSTMIPQMFEPGAIDLLLSKPISRSGAFLAKFVGGCAFIFLNAVLFVGGLWLILGLRHGQWRPELFWTIPLFLLAFTIYFSISAYVGVRWKNPILSIALTLVAWLVTFTLHQTWYFGQRLALDGDRAEVLLMVDDAPLVARKSGEVIRWQGGQWQPIFGASVRDPAIRMQQRTGLMYPMLGPIALQKAQGPVQLLAVERQGLPGLFSDFGSIVIGSADSGFERETGPATPHDSFSLLALSAEEGLLATHSGLRLLQLSDEAGESAGVTIGPGTPADIRWPGPAEVTIDRGDGAVAVYSRGRVTLLNRQADGGYAIKGEMRVDDPSPALIGLTRRYVVLARGDGTITLLDRGQLSNDPVPLQLDAAPKRLIAAAESRGLWILDHRRRLHRLSDEGVLSLADIRGQQDVTAAAVTADGQLLVADRFPRITAYSSTGVLQQTWQNHTGFAWFYLWFVSPLRTLLPKPDELDLLVREAVGVRDADERPTGLNLTQEREYVDIWTPVWTSSLFVIAMLGLTCWSIERKDF